MTYKRVLRPDRLRRVPAHFSWVDHRLVRDGHLQGCGVEALALYLLLVSVGDAQGLSYYSDRTVAGLLEIDSDEVRRARCVLQRADLIAYRKPLYQVLDLDPERRMPRRNGEACVGDILTELLGGVS